jgi:hypothetical protein
MMAAVLVAIALAIGSLAPTLVAAREDLVRATVTRVACIDLELAAAIAAACPLDDDLTALDRQARERRRAAAIAGTVWQGDLDHFEAFCATLTLDSGRRFVLEPFQRTILADYFRGTVETLVLLPKKNGKTTLLAALVVYHLCYVDEARCYVAASSRDQATILYDHAKGFVNRSAALQRRVLVRAGTRELRSRRDDGFVKVLAADSDTADGVGPTLAIVDELHRHKSTALYDVFSDGLDARDGRMLTISTAGDDEEGPLGLMRSNYLAMPGKKIRGRYTYCRSRDGLNVMHEWALRPTDNLEDLKLVKSVNPLRTMTVAKLRRRRDSKSMTPSRWARFACNVWTQGEDAAIATLDWARKSRPGCRIPAGGPVPPVIGIDAGWTRDTTGLVPVGFPDGTQDEAIIDERLIIIPAGTQAGPGRLPAAARDLPPHLRELAATWPGRVEEGRMTDERVVKGALIRLWLIWPDCSWAIDPNAGGLNLAQWIEAELAGGVEERVRIASQQPAPMQAASMHFAGGVRTAVAQAPREDLDDDDDDNLRTVPVFHPDDEELNRHVRAAVARWNGERWRFDKRRVPPSQSSKVQPRPIDGAIAATIAYHALMAPPPEALTPFVFRA